MLPLTPGCVCQRPKEMTIARPPHTAPAQAARQATIPGWASGLPRVQWITEGQRDQGRATGMSPLPSL